MMDLIDITASAIEERDRLRELLKQAAEHQQDLVQRAAELLRSAGEQLSYTDNAGRAWKWYDERDQWLRDANFKEEK